MSGLRLYAFVNAYLSSIQQGIQTQHAAQELTNKYVFDGSMALDDERVKILRDWSLRHKTTVVLNGGDNGGIASMFDLIEEVDGLGNPYACFREDDRSLGGIMTSVAVVLPKEVYDAVPYSKVFGSNVTDRERLDFTEKYPKHLYSGSWFWHDWEKNEFTVYHWTSKHAAFLNAMKKCQLAR